MDEFGEIREQINTMLLNAKDAGKDRELRLFACWCARKTSPRKSCKIAIEVAEQYAEGHIGIEELSAKRDSMKGFAIATATIGSKHNPALATSDMASFQTLREDAYEAATMAFNHFLRHKEFVAKEGTNSTKIEAKMLTSVSQALKTLSNYLSNRKITLN